ncbi:MAG: hypothetical protein CBD18_07210 [Opitutales bacterium TMED158]|nr:MAG: hypothetical protein CBD18_07210 [Opitutales bacterium TMED158]
MPPLDRETSLWFESEVQPHEPGLRAYLLGTVGTSDIDDLIQETYIRILKAKRRGDVQSPRGLLFTIARNLSRDLFRRRSKVSVFPITDSDSLRVLGDKPGLEEAVARRDEAELLEQAILSLPERCRMILIYRKLENLSHREIAAKMGITVHTVESQLTKGLHRCEKFFRSKGAVFGN